MYLIEYIGKKKWRFLKLSVKLWKYNLATFVESAISSLVLKVLNEQENTLSCINNY